ncbi:uncharacterized protein J7T54_001164 [Emericellopsis cladophorae]|uniref:Uncharacterized protein n=1 Tax=Emericellopsis cladophorae TaxID=2686198 RepID=A0A9P9Y050_9HYPO|nr:uncharacterized protein J7T54_001164 [Emericellopsis cladophorae]KAI6780660.1 hypothetical protein J7T54_001164 [Emericellopsis cladophorae]
MSAASLQSFAYPGLGEWARDNLGYMQAIRVGDRIECSGQGGWDPDSEVPKFSENIAEEIEQAFANVDRTIRHAGGKGWPQVYRVNSYHLELTPEVTAAMTAGFKTWMPNHKPIWTQVGVRQLGAPGMRVEIEVVALDC